MRCTTVIHGGATRAAFVTGEGLFLQPESSLSGLLADDAWEQRDPRQGELVDPQDVEFAQLVQPSKVICIGLNYRAHILERGREVPEFPTLFAKYSDALCSPYADIARPPHVDSLDWEGELCIVIGRESYMVDRKDALSHVAGYTVGNDTSLRDWQHRTLQWFQGKNLERATPIGDTLVTGDEIDHAADLRLTTTVDGEVVQDARTSDLVFGPAELVAYVSSVTRLQPGDIIMSGTPGGVGAARNPPRFLEAGSVVEVTLEDVATCRNRIIQP